MRRVKKAPRRWQIVREIGHAFFPVLFSLAPSRKPWQHASAERTRDSAPVAEPVCPSSRHFLGRRTVLNSPLRGPSSCKSFGDFRVQEGSTGCSAVSTSSTRFSLQYFRSAPFPSHHGDSVARRTHLRLVQPGRRGEVFPQTTSFSHASCCDLRSRRWPTTVSRSLARRRDAVRDVFALPHRNARSEPSRDATKTGSQRVRAETERGLSRQSCRSSVGRRSLLPVVLTQPASPTQMLSNFNESQPCTGARGSSRSRVGGWSLSPNLSQGLILQWTPQIEVSLGADTRSPKGLHP